MNASNQALLRACAFQTWATGNKSVRDAARYLGGLPPGPHAVHILEKRRLGLFPWVLSQPHSGATIIAV